MEGEPKVESQKELPEEIVKRFLSFVEHAADDINVGGVMWSSAVDALFRKVSDLERELIEECEERGLVRVKARFIEELFHQENETGAGSLGGSRNVLERIINFE